MPPLAWFYVGLSYFIGFFVFRDLSNQVYRDDDDRVGTGCFMAFVWLLSPISVPVILVVWWFVPSAEEEK